MKRLRGRLIATYLVVVAVSTVALGAYLLNSLRHYYVEQLRLQLRAQALLAADIARPSLRVDSQTGGAAQSLARELAKKTGTRVTIIAQDGEVLGDSEEDPSNMENHADRPEFAAALATGFGFSTRYSATLGMNMMYVAVRVGDVGGVVRVALPLATVRYAVVRLWSTVLIAVLLAVLVAIFTGFAMARRIARPVEEMTRLAGQIAAGDFDCRVRPRTADEIAALGLALNTMAASLKKTVGKLSQTSARLEAVLRDIAAGVVFCDREGKVTLLNPAAARMLGTGRRDVLDRSHVEVLRNYDLSAAVDQVLRDQAPLSKVLTLVHPREIIVHASISSVRGEGEGSGGVVVLLHDITALKRLERARSELVAAVSHELKTPVTSVKGFAETLLEGGLDDPAVSREFVTVIHDEAERLARLITDLLELSRIESGELWMQPAPLDLGPVIRQIADRKRAEAEKAGLALAVRGGEGPFWVLADKVRIEQVLVNLVDNAIRYTPRGGNLCLSARREGKDVRVEVSDTGIGIPPEHLPRVFERFYRADPARSRKHGGSGLGLSIVKHIVERHGGRVGAESEPDRGSTFWFTLPSPNLTES